MCPSLVAKVRKSRESTIHYSHVNIASAYRRMAQRTVVYENHTAFGMLEGMQDVNKGVPYGNPVT